MNIISGNTTFTLGNDHILNGDYGIVPRVGEPMSDEIAGFAPDGLTTDVAATSTAFATSTPTNTVAFAQNLGTIKESMGLGVVQKMDIGTVAINYAPHAGEKAVQADTFVGDNTQTSGYEIMFVGGFGVPGLNTAINYYSEGKNGTDTKDAEQKSFGASYTVASVKFGAEISKFEKVDGSENDTQEIGITFKVNDQMTFGVGATETDGQDSTGLARPQDEKIKYLQAGYNLGAVGLGLSYIDGDSIGGVANVDTKGLVLKMATKF